MMALALVFFGSVSYGQEDWIFRAMKDEMTRTVSDLKIEPSSPPYYISTKVVDFESFSVRASLGSIVTSGRNGASRLINIQLRVGNRSFDNSAAPLTYGSSGGMVYVSEDGEKYSVSDTDYAALRRDIWLATDALYKRALGDYSRKKAALENRVRNDTTPDFSAAAPVEYVESIQPFVVDPGRLTGLAKRLSAVFRIYGDIFSSDVNIGTRRDVLRFLNSEGSHNVRCKPRVWVEVTARTQAVDGMPLSDFVAFFGKTMSDLPPEDEMVRQIHAMAKSLTALRNAPVLEEYSGPVLFEQQAAAELISQVLGPNLRNVVLPVNDNPQMEQTVRNQFGELPFLNKINARVLPRFLSVRDQPTLTSFGNTPVLADYTVDEEGVRAKDVLLIDKGFLKTLLTSRTPHKKIPESNGHARTDPSQAFFSTLVVTADRSLADRQLKSRFMELCKEVGLPYGIVIRKLHNPYFAAQLREAGSSTSAGRAALLDPVVVVKMYPNGREETVRGAEFAGMTTQSLKEIVAVSKDRFVYNHITKQKRTTMSGMYNATDVRATIVTPSLLFESVDLRRGTQPFRTPPIVPSPLSEK